MSVDTLSPHEEIAKQEEARGLELLREQAMKDLVVHPIQKAEGRGGLEAMEQNEKLDVVNGILQEIGGKEITTILASGVPMDEKRKRILSKAEYMAKAASRITLQRQYHASTDGYYSGGQLHNETRSREQQIKDGVRRWAQSVEQGTPVGAEGSWRKEQPSIEKQIDVLEGAFVAQMGIALQAKEMKGLAEALKTLNFIAVVKDSSVEKEVIPFVAVFSKVRNGIGNAEEQGNMDALVKPLGLLWDSKKGAYQKL